jgi:predicted GNAT superfamily acetyltransferase
MLGEDHRIETIAAQSPQSQAALLALNNLHADQTSLLDAGRWRSMVSEAFAATVTADDGAFLLAFDQSAAYDSTNFLWFRARLPRFVYVDRIVVAQPHRQRGLGRLLYDDLFARARAAGHDRIVCEINFDPPNPVSDAFHARLGFTEVGRGPYASNRVVRYLERLL